MVFTRGNAIWSEEERLTLHSTLSIGLPCLSPWFHSSFSHLPSLPIISYFLVQFVVFDLSCTRSFSTPPLWKCSCPFDKVNLVITCMPRQRASSFQDGSRAWLSPGYYGRTLWGRTLSSAMWGRVQIQRRGVWSYEHCILCKCDLLTPHTWDWCMRGQKWSSEDWTQ